MSLTLLLPFLLAGEPELDCPPRWPELAGRARLVAQLDHMRVESFLWHLAVEWRKRERGR